MCNIWTNVMYTCKAKWYDWLVGLAVLWKKRLHHANLPDLVAVAFARNISHLVTKKMKIAVILSVSITQYSVYIAEFSVNGVANSFCCNTALVYVVHRIYNIHIPTWCVWVSGLYPRVQTWHNYQILFLIDQDHPTMIYTISFNTQ